ncbi:C-X-C chemokine receptor type 5 [Acipenser ruthenus]|uniref:C-X-C chemokine receptor type 5 n=1 Tax=Acipenser ruthenus TaxID=7906 RepID=A0A444V5V5_ACIRT|nr:C-X-C chemokine receptor type 5 [Acipenser ruthenus]
MDGYDTTKITLDVSDLLMFDEYNDTYASGSNLDAEYTCDNDSPLGLASIERFRTIFLPVVNTIVFLTGVCGNGLVLVILKRNRRSLGVTELYLLHLALADLLLLLVFPFSLVQALGGWVFGPFLCKVVGVVYKLNFYCGGLLLGCIGFDRYLAVVHAVKRCRGRQAHTVHLICGAVWLLCFCFSVPNAAFLSVSPAGYNNSSDQLSCSFTSYGTHGYNWDIASRFLAHILGFFLPLAAMVYCYSAIVATLCRSQQSFDKHRAIRLALLVTGVFGLCWLPYNVALFLQTLVVLGVVQEESCSFRDALSHAVTVTESVGYMHCCLNPILYAFVGVRFRQDLLRLLRDVGCLRAERAESLSQLGRTRMSYSEGASTSTTAGYNF